MLRRGLSFLVICITLISCEEIVTVENISNDTVQILAPINKAQLINENVSFNWEELSGVDNYQLQIATPNFSAATQIVLDTLLTSRSFVQTLEAKQYEWRIKGVNSAYETAYIINAFSVLVDLSDKTITLLNPDDNTTLAPGDVSFTWEALAGAENYKLQIASPDFSSETNNVRDTIISTTSFIQTLEAISYKWRVKGMNAVNETEYTERTLIVEEP